jgi:hypothetical protein
MGCLLGAALIFAFDSSMELGVAAGMLYVTVVLPTLWSRRVSLPFAMAALGTALTGAGLFTSPQGGDLWKILVNRGLTVFVLWTTALLITQQVRLLEQREAARRELRVLQGLLPICASCKRIKDERGEWTQLEPYIAEHSEADFTHGICPECAEKLYPNRGRPSRTS